MNLLRTWMLVLDFTLGLTGAFGHVADAATASAHVTAFDQVLTTLKEHAATLPPPPSDWEPQAATLSAHLRAGGATSDAAFVAALDSLLALWPGRGAHLLAADDPRYRVLSSKFSGLMAGHACRQTGLWLERRGKRWFVSHSFAGSAAAATDLQRGDEIVAIDGVPLAAGAPPDWSAKTDVQLTYKRLVWEAPRSVKVRTTDESWQQIMLHALNQGPRLRSVHGRVVAYLDLAAVSHTDLRQAAEAALRRAETGADALVLDLRRDYGGADLALLEPFFQLPTANQREGGRGPAPVFPAVWTKPLVVLIDAGTSSGREILARALKQEKRALLVGQPTAGLPFPQTWVPLNTGAAAMPAMALVLPEDGNAGKKGGSQLQRGEPLAPDLNIEAPLPYAGGGDPQLDTAYTQAAAMAHD